jgi:hypothetical protein
MAKIIENELQLTKEINEIANRFDPELDYLIEPFKYGDDLLYLINKFGVNIEHMGSTVDAVISGFDMANEFHEFRENKSTLVAAVCLVIVDWASKGAPCGTQENT